MEVLDTLISCLRRCCAALPDRRTGANARYTMADIGLSAFSVFFLQSPSFLAYQRQLAEGHGRSNCQTLFGITSSHFGFLGCGGVGWLGWGRVWVGSGGG